MRTPIKQLRNDIITVTPIRCDWSKGYPDRWDYYVAERCSTCGKVVLNVHGEDRHSDLDDTTDCEGYVYADGPMMNYYYPIPEPRDLDEAQRALVNSPLCIVHFEDDDLWALALTGGGMDLSWEICEAFMRLGYLPPVHFASDLPHMAGMTATPTNRWIVAGCRRSLSIAREWQTRGLERLRRTSAWLKSNGAQL
jgi:hypothetical protein